MEDCLFCKIAKGEISSERVSEDETTFAFLDIQPRAPGHTMVIPKTHVQNFSELPDELVEPFFKTVKKVTLQIKRALAPHAFTLGMNHGRESGQEVDHLHFHIIPRWRGDGGGPIQLVVSNKPKEDLKALADKIRAAT